MQDYEAKELEQKRKKEEEQRLEQLRKEEALRLEKERLRREEEERKRQQLGMDGIYIAVGEYDGSTWQRTVHGRPCLEARIGGLGRGASEARGRSPEEGRLWGEESKRITWCACQLRFFSSLYQEHMARWTLTTAAWPAFSIFLIICLGPLVSHCLIRSLLEALQDQEAQRRKAPHLKSGESTLVMMSMP